MSAHSLLGAAGPPAGAALAGAVPLTLSAALVELPAASSAVALASAGAASAAGSGRLEPCVLS